MPHKIFSNYSKNLEHLSNLLHSEMVFIDIGAGTGQYIFQVNKTIKIGSLYAIEPDRQKFEELTQNSLEWEELADNCIYPMHIAIGDCEVPSGAASEAVKAYRMDTLFDRVDPDLIRIGVKGRELQILKGSTKLLRRGKVRFLLTASEHGENSFAEVCHLMSSWGYRSKNFYGQKLFTNPHKLFVHHLRRNYRHWFPVAFRQKLNPLFRGK